MNARPWAAAVLAAVLAGCTPNPAPAMPQTTLTAPRQDTAAAALALLTVRYGPDPAGYRRAAFGAAWADVDHNGCNTRNDMLRHDLDDVEPATGCHVRSGVLHDPYTGATVQYRGGNAVQIDHVVSLGDAWRSGADTWTPQRRLQYANYPPNLLATSGSVNESKGDESAATWQPPDASFGCRYAAIVTNTKTTFALSVTPAERDALARLLAPCPDEPMRGAP